MRCGASTDSITSCTVNPQPENRLGDTVKNDSAFDLTTAAPTFKDELIANLFSGRRVALTRRLLTRHHGWLLVRTEEEHLQHRAVVPPPHPDPHHGA